MCPHATTYVSSYDTPEISDFSKVSTLKGKFLSDPTFAFTLEVYANGASAPNILPKEVDIAQTDPFLLTNTDFLKTQVVKTYTHNIVAPAIDYWKCTIEVKKGAQVERMKWVRIFNPMHVLTNDTPVPNILPKEVDIAQTAPFLLTNTDFLKTQVVKAYAHNIVAPAIDYWKWTIEFKKGAQVERMKWVRIFNPMHVLTNKISVSDIEGMKIFKLSQHPQIILQIEVMKTEVITYQTLADFIKSLVERKYGKGKDTFDISDWWHTNSAKLPSFTYVLRTVLTNSPNSCPPERLFSIFNSTFDANLWKRNQGQITLHSSLMNKNGLTRYTINAIKKTSRVSQEKVEASLLVNLRNLSFSFLIKCGIH